MPRRRYDETTTNCKAAPADGWTLWTGATAAIDRAGRSVATDNADDRIMLLYKRLHNQSIGRNLTPTCDWHPGDLW